MVFHQRVQSSASIDGATQLRGSRVHNWKVLESTIERF